MPGAIPDLFSGAGLPSIPHRLESHPPSKHLHGSPRPRPPSLASKRPYAPHRGSATSGPPCRVPWALLPVALLRWPPLPKRPYLAPAISWKTKRHRGGLPKPALPTWNYRPCFYICYPRRLWEAVWGLSLCWLLSPSSPGTVPGRVVTL